MSDITESNLWLNTAMSTRPRHSFNHSEFLLPLQLTLQQSFASRWIFPMAMNVVENKRETKWENQTVIVWKESSSVCFCQLAFTPSIQHLHLQISVTIYKMAHPIQLYIYIYICLWFKYRWGSFLPHITVGICTRLEMLTVDVVLSAQLLLHQPVFHH